LKIKITTTPVNQSTLFNQFDETSNNNENIMYENKNYIVIPTKSILKNTFSKCRTRGCDGSSNTRKDYSTHTSVKFCPKAAIDSKPVTKQQLDESVEKYKFHQEKVDQHKKKNTNS